MNVYIERSKTSAIITLLDHFPAVAITGPRQVGKTALAQKIGNQCIKGSVYLDCENPEDISRLANPIFYLSQFIDKCVIIDEIQQLPELFPVLRGLIDKDRKAGRFILSGSASPSLVHKSSNALTGRIAYVELTPLNFQEVFSTTSMQTHWFRGGFPDALLAATESSYRSWVQNYIRNYIYRDLPWLGMRSSPVYMERLWKMCAHLNGTLLNIDSLARSLSVSASTIRRHIEFFESAYLVRILYPFHTNLKKRLIKSPKIFLRDTGILHSLLGISSINDLLGHPGVGASWEAYVVNQLFSILPDNLSLYFYRTADGTEADIVVVRGNIPLSVVEIKFTTAPRIGKSLTVARHDLGNIPAFIVCPIPKSFAIQENVTAIAVHDIPHCFLSYEGQ